MKKIALAIDFSKTSLNAINYAINLANKFEADLNMIWVNKPNVDESIYPEQNELVKEKVENRFKDIENKFQPKLKGKLSFTILQGKIYKTVIEYATNINADLIIAGSHGISGFEEFWMGSNAYRIVSNSDLPVLTVREKYQTKPELIKKIVLPIDKTIETRQKVPFTTKIAKKFDAEIHIVALYTTHYEDLINKIKSYVYQTVEYLNNLNIKCFVEEIFEENAEEATLKYAKSINADLISIMTKHQISPKAYFIGLYSQHMVNHSPIPVLTTEPQDLFNYTAEFIKTV